MLIRFLTLTCLVGFTLSAWGEVSIRQPAYSAELDGDWVEVSCTIEDQISLISRSRSAQARIQHFTDIKIRPEAMEKIARGTIELGIKQEPGNSRGKPFTILGQSVEQMAGGYRAAYYGRDETKRSFRFVSLILPTKVLNIYVEMPSAFEPNLEAVTNSIVERVRY
jgi:hypothetical protein